jgi:hypothetical protein
MIDYIKSKNNRRNEMKTITENALENLGKGTSNANEFLFQTASCFTGHHGQPTAEQELTRFVNLSQDEQLREITDWADGMNITDETPKEILDDILATIEQ